MPTKFNRTVEIDVLRHSSSKCKEDDGMSLKNQNQDYISNLNHFVFMKQYKTLPKNNLMEAGKN